MNVQIPGNRLSLYDITLRGALYGGCNSHYDIPRFARLYDEGHLKLNELITKRYTVDQVAQAYSDVREGRVIRGMLEHSTADGDAGGPCPAGSPNPSIVAGLGCAGGR